MKAIFYEKYGQPDVLGLREVDVPVVKDDEVLVRVRAASINSWDWDLVRGTPLVIRLWGVLKPRVFQAMFLGALVSLFGSKKMGVLGLKPNRNLATLNELFEAGKVAPVIDKHYPLSDAPETMRHFAEGHFRGKIVITI